MTYNELVAQIKAYAENEFPSTVGMDSAAQIDSFIRAAEQKIYAILQLPHLRGNVSGLTKMGSPYISLPADFLTLSSVMVESSGRWSHLLVKDESFMRESYPDPDDLGVPRFIAIFGPVTSATEEHTYTRAVSAIMAPTPAGDYPIQLRYFQLPVSITDKLANPQGRTWLGDNFPTLLFSAALVEAAVFMQMEDAMIKGYKDQYQTALTAATTMNLGITPIGGFRQ